MTNRQKVNFALLVLACMGIGLGVGLCLATTTVSYTNQVPALDTIIEERKEVILASEDFKNEVNALVTARALYQLSVERQDIAVQLSEKALESYQVSNELEDKWHLSNHE